MWVITTSSPRPRLAVPQPWATRLIESVVPLVKMISSASAAPRKRRMVWRVCS